MRYLSKIIFVNSAHIRYAEVRLDGNVHFTGTQGVGKSTLLRAILFFYNADPGHLGIRRQGQRSFDEFYLPGPNSYIFYEVTRGDELPFTVIVFRQKSRAVFRFADAPFNRSWIIDDSGVVTGEPAEVRRRIQGLGIDASRIIDRYVDYREVIYGYKNSSMTRDLRKYSILQSTDYENVPRIIQNVFLNERVDADFIKDTIIKAVSGDTELAVNLKYFRGQLAAFTDEYNDIQKWSKLDPHGRCPTLERGRHIGECLRQLHEGRAQLDVFCGNFVYALAEAEKRLPLSVARSKQIDEKIAAIEAKLADLDSRFLRERDRLVGAISTINDTLERSKELRKKYRELGIDSMIALEQQRPLLTQKRDSLAGQIALLDERHGDIIRKYEALIGTLRNREAQAKNDSQRRLNDAQREYNADERTIQSEAKDAIDRMEADSRRRIDEIREEISGLRMQLVDLGHQLRQAESAAPLADEIIAIRQRIEGIAREEVSLKADIEKAESECRVLQKDSLIEINEIKNDCGRQIEKKRSELKQIDAKIKEEEDLLGRSQGAFCEWLDENRPDWADTIGKVVDERNILYNPFLSPSLAQTGGDTLFGVSIDLEGVERCVRTPAEIRSSLQSLTDQRDGLLNEVRAIEKECGDKVDAIEKKYGALMKKKSDEKRESESALKLIPVRKKKEKIALEDVEKRQAEMVARRVAELSEERDALIVKERERTGIVGELEKRIADARKKLQKERDRRLKESAQRFEDLRKRLDTELKEELAAIAGQIATLKEAQEGDLREQGVDVKMRKDLQRQLDEVNATLVRIEKNHDEIVCYEKDKRELFDLEPQRIAKKNDLKKKLEELEEKSNSKKAELTAKKDERQKEFNELEAEIRSLREDIEQARSFRSSPDCPAFIEECGKIPTSEPCRAIVSAIKSTIMALGRTRAELKKTVNEFRREFSQRNTFKFPEALETDADYEAYAGSVDDFIVNNKIAEVQDLSNHVYRDILGRVSREFEEIAHQESDIQKIVNEVNRDFSQKKFAGVIRSIEIRLEKSDQPIVRLLQEIHEFWIENADYLDEMNLFAADDGGVSKKKAVDCLKRLSTILERHAELERLGISDTFSLKFKIEENDNSTGWVDNIRMIGSDGTDILVKAIINILLISVFKQRVARKGSDFMVHCMMDEIGKLADENIQGILDFANSRGIFIVNSSPGVHRPLSYRYLYLLTKDKDSNTRIQPILSTRQAPVNS